MGAEIATNYKLHVTLDKMAYNPGDFINGTFCFDFGNDQFKKKNLRIKNPAVVLEIIQYETIKYRMSAPKTKQSTLTSQAINIKQLLDIHKNPDGMFTFTLQVPQNALPSFEWPHQELLNCNLRSIVQVEVKDCKAIGNCFVVIKKKFNSIKITFGNY